MAGGGVARYRAGVSRPPVTIVTLVSAALCALLIASCGSGAGTACNGADALCDRPYDQVAYAMTHNGFANEADRFAPPNHFNTMTQQLEDGIRGLMLDVHTDTVTGLTSLCHGACAFGRRPLVDGLAERLDHTPLATATRKTWSFEVAP